MTILQAAKLSFELEIRAIEIIDAHGSRRRIGNVVYNLNDECLCGNMIGFEYTRENIIILKTDKFFPYFF